MSPKRRYIIPLIDKHIPAYGEVMSITTHRVLSLLSGKLTDEGCAILANHKSAREADADMLTQFQGIPNTAQDPQCQRKRERWLMALAVANDHIDEMISSLDDTQYHG